MAEKLISVEVKGLDKVIANLQATGPEITQALAAALFMEAEATMAESKLEVPVDTGALRASGTVKMPVINPDSVTVEMGYGGAAAPYAVFVHEDLTKHHPNGNAKFLEGPANRRASGMAERVGKKLQERLR
jgi:Bacteriophage HK97-gp10, putative tail-component